MRILLLLPLLLSRLFVSPVSAHDEGSEEFPCDEGPFGVPGLQLPASQIGQWSAVTSWPERATHTTLLHTGKVLWWRGSSANGVQATTYVWDPIQGTLDTYLTAEDNIFCAGLGALADGRAISLGGTVGPSNAAGLPDTNLFDPSSESWAMGDESTYGRWYPTLTTLADGRVLATSGRIQKSPVIIATIPEIYDPELDLWTELPSASLNLSLYPPMYLLPNGLVLNPATSGTTRTLDVSTQSWQFVATSNFANSQGSSAMYRPGQVMKLGGGSIGTAFAELIDMTQATPSWRVVDAMEFPRRRPDLVILPDGSLLAIGGSIEGQSSPECAMHAAEVWDPGTELWTTWASMARPRIYHSTALLLPDGRLLVAGGENSHVSGGERNYEIFSPPYLFQGGRPQIQAAPAEILYGQRFSVATALTASIQSVALMRPSSVTHNLDQSQRYLPLTFTSNASALQIDAPADGNLAPPGYYMLFLVDGNGVPSEAHFLRLGVDVEPVPLLGAGASTFLVSLLGAIGGGYLVARGRRQ